MKEKINIFFSKLKEKRNILISNPSSFEQKFSITLSRISYLTISVLTILLLGVAIFFIISYTSLKQYIPGYPDTENALKVIETDQANLELITQIQKENIDRELWIKNLKNILSDNDSISLDSLKAEIKKDSNNYKNIIFERPIEDSILREKIANENIIMEEDAIEGMLRKLNFTPPVYGSFMETKPYVGIDLKTELNEAVRASMKGIVIAKTDNSAIIQHPNNIVSVYKNCLTLKLNEGENITRGKQIGVVTDSVFHFELWYNGKAVNPKKYLNE